MELERLRDPDDFRSRLGFSSCGAGGFERPLGLDDRFELWRDDPDPRRPPDRDPLRNNTLADLKARRYKSPRTGKTGPAIIAADLGRWQKLPFVHHLTEVGADLLADLWKVAEDGAARASKATLEIAKKANLTILPSCASRDDLIPAVKLANELVQGGIDRNHMAFALCRVTTEAETNDARDFLESAGFRVLAGALVEKPAYRQAQNEGLAVTETRYKTLNQKADELLTDLTNLLLTE